MNQGNAAMMWVALATVMVLTQPAAAVGIGGKKPHKAARPVQKAGKKNSAKAATRPGEKRRISLSAVLDRMQQVIDKTKSFTADFEQTYQSILGFGEEQPQRGKVRLRKPGHIRWDYVDAKGSPTKAFIVDGDVLWIVDHRKRQAHFNRCFRQDSLSAPLTFLWGRGKLKQTFEARWFDPNFSESNSPPPGEKEKKDGKKESEATLRGKSVAAVSMGKVNQRVGRESRGGFIILLTPRQPCGVLRELIVTVDGVSFQILGTELVDPSGNRNRFTYRNLRRNVVLGDATFTFRPPKGMKVFPIPGSCSPQNPSPAQSKATPRR